MGKIDLDSKEDKKEPEEAPEKPETPESTETEPATDAPEDSVEENSAEPGKTIEAKADSLKGLTVVGKIELPKEAPKKAKTEKGSDDDARKRPRKRIQKPE